MRGAKGLSKHKEQKNCGITHLAKNIQDTETDWIAYVVYVGKSKGTVVCWQKSAVCLQKQADFYWIDLYKHACGSADRLQKSPTNQSTYRIRTSGRSARVNFGAKFRTNIITILGCLWPEGTIYYLVVFAKIWLLPLIHRGTLLCTTRKTYILCSCFTFCTFANQAHCSQ